MRWSSDYLRIFIIIRRDDYASQGLSRHREKENALSKKFKFVFRPSLGVCEHSRESRGKICPPHFRREKFSSGIWKQLEHSEKIHL